MSAIITNTPTTQIDEPRLSETSPTMSGVKPKLRPGRKSTKPPAELKKTYNAATYKRNIWAYKLRHTFYVYPNIPIDHKDEITAYFVKHGDTVDEALVTFIRSFVVHRPRGVPPDPNSKTSQAKQKSALKKERVHKIIVPSQLAQCLEDAKTRLLPPSDTTETCASWRILAPPTEDA